MGGGGMALLQVCPQGVWLPLHVAGRLLCTPRSTQISIYRADSTVDIMKGESRPTPGAPSGPTTGGL